MLSKIRMDRSDDVEAILELMGRTDAHYLEFGDDGSVDLRLASEEHPAYAAATSVNAPVPGPRSVGGAAASEAGPSNTQSDRAQAGGPEFIERRASSRPWAHMPAMVDRERDRSRFAARRGEAAAPAPAAQTSAAGTASPAAAADNAFEQLRRCAFGDVLAAIEHSRPLAGITERRSRAA